MYTFKIAYAIKYINEIQFAGIGGSPETAVDNWAVSLANYDLALPSDFEIVEIEIKIKEMKNKSIKL